jgi:hypothetical protein
MRSICHRFPSGFQIGTILVALCIGVVSLPSAYAATATMTSPTTAGYFVHGSQITSVATVVSVAKGSCSSIGPDSDQFLLVYVQLSVPGTYALYDAGYLLLCNNNSGPTYQAFFGDAPSSFIYTPISLTGGQKVSISLTLESGSLISQVTDLNTGKSVSRSDPSPYGTTVYTSAGFGVTADSDPYPGTSAYLIHFTSPIVFSKASATNSGKSTVISKFSHVTEETMSYKSVTMAQASALSSGGNSFSVTWKSNTP